MIMTGWKGTEKGGGSGGWEMMRTAGVGILWS